MMLLNGGVLGLVREEFPETLQKAGDRWRVATLLVTCGMILFIVQPVFEHWWVRPLANALLTLGLTFYGRALRQFNGAPDRAWMLIPTALTFFGVMLFDSVLPSLMGRITVATSCWLFVMLDTLYMLGFREQERAASHRLMIVIYAVVAGFASLRLGWLLLGPEPVASPLDDNHLINVLSPVVMGVLPVIGTTVFLLMCSDRLRRDWERAATIDYLTGLPNRRTLVERAREQFQRGDSEGSGMCVAMIDIDHFKQINDRHGHDVGDDALRHVAALLARATRAGDLLARVGGEEFVMVTRDAGPDECRQYMERLCSDISAVTLRCGPNDIHLTISIGLSARRPEDHSFGDLLRRADGALYRAKEEGRNTVRSAVS